MSVQDITKMLARDGIIADVKASGDQLIVAVVNDRQHEFRLMDLISLDKLVDAVKP